MLSECTLLTLLVLRRRWWWWLTLKMSSALISSVVASCWCWWSVVVSGVCCCCCCCGSDANRRNHWNMLCWDCCSGFAKAFWALLLTKEKEGEIQTWRNSSAGWSGVSSQQRKEQTSRDWVSQNLGWTTEKESSSVVCSFPAFPPGIQFHACILFRTELRIFNRTWENAIAQHKPPKPNKHNHINNR